MIMEGGLGSHVSFGSRCCYTRSEGRSVQANAWMSLAVLQYRLTMGINS